MNTNGVDNAAAQTLTFNAYTNVNGTFGVSGITTLSSGNVRAIVEKTANYIILNSDYTLLGDTTAVGAFTFTLPASPVNGQMHNIKNIGANTLTISHASDTIDGASSMTLYEDESITIQYYSTDTDWAIL